MKTSSSRYAATSIPCARLYALMLKLRPRKAGYVWPNAGQLAHGALLAWLAAVDADLATRLHEPNQDRPFTCSSLWFPNEQEVAHAQRENRQLPVTPNQVYWLRLTLLRDELFRTLTTRFLRPAAPINDSDIGLPTLRLGTIEFEVAELLAMPSEATGSLPRQPETWAGFETYEGLVARARGVSLNVSAYRNITLAFHSPTAFSDGQVAWGKRMHLFPDPDRVFDRLARVWNRWAPPEFALDVQAIQRYARDWVAVASFDLRTRLLHFDRHAQLGFVGRCVYALMESERRSAGTPSTRFVGADLNAAQAIHLLTSFAFYAGVGQKTTMGMGQTRVLTAALAKRHAPDGDEKKATVRTETDIQCDQREINTSDPSARHGAV